MPLGGIKQESDQAFRQPGEAHALPCKPSNLQSSQLVWRGDSYLMCLPLDIHFLLIEHDGALLAA